MIGDFNYYFGSLADFLIEKNITNESVMMILLDFKISWKVNDSYDNNVINNFLIISNDYPEKERNIIKDWINKNYMPTLNFNFYNKNMVH